MSGFGWAYINCEDSGSGGGGGGGHAGPIKSVQFLTSSTGTSGSESFTYDNTAAILQLTGTLIVSGTISASYYHIEDVAIIDSSGSTYFGNTDDDEHVRTGSFYVGASGSAASVFDVNLTTQQVSVKGFRGGYTAITSSGMTSSAGSFIYGVSVAGDINLRLHSAIGDNLSGAVYVVKDELAAVRTGAILIQASGSDTIDGGATYQLSGSYPAISLYSNGTNWFVF